MRNLEGNIIQGKFVFALIAEGNIFKFKVAFHMGCFIRAGIFFRFHIQNAEQGLTGCHAALELGVDVR